MKKPNHRYRNPKGGMVTRFTKKQQDRAADIANFIAEHDDFEATMDEMAMAVNFYRDMSVVNWQRFSSLRTCVFLVLSRHLTKRSVPISEVAELFYDFQKIKP